MLSHQYLRDRLTLHSLTLCRKPQIFRLQCFLHCFSLLILVSSLFYLQQFLQIVFYDFKNALLPLLKFIVSVDIFSPSEFSMQKSLNMLFSISILCFPRFSKGISLPSLKSALPLIINVLCYTYIYFAKNQLSLSLIGLSLLITSLLKLLQQLRVRSSHIFSYTFNLLMIRSLRFGSYYYN